MLMSRRHPQGGFTFIELMIGIVVGMIVIAAATTIYVTTVRGSAETLRQIKLNQELRAIMDVMVSDIRRAGYWANTVTGDPSNPVDNIPTLVDPAASTQVDPDNPFTVRTQTNADAASPALTGPTDINILSGGNCILYTYDASYRAGNAYTVDTTDFFGFRLSGDAIQMPTASASMTNNAAGDICTSSTWAWSAVNDTNTVAVDTLTFSTVGSQCRNTTTNDSWSITDTTATGPACDCTTCTGYVAPSSGDLLVETRQIRIGLTGHHVNDTNAVISFTEQVKLRNNRLVMTP